MIELRAVLQRAVRRVCPRWLVDRSEDLVQVAMMKVLDARGRNEGLGVLPSSYLYKVAYTTLVDEIRRLRRRPEIPSRKRAMATARRLPSRPATPRSISRQVR